MASSPELVEMRFKRFLHYGSELPIYKPGDRFHREAYVLANVPSLVKYLEDAENPQSAVDLIVKVKTEGTSLWPDSLVFALALCSVQQDKPKLVKAVYEQLRTVCTSPRDIILFVKFRHDLTPNRGGGNGFKRAISNWYLVWMPFDLAEIFLSQQSYYGWSHLDLIRLSHAKPVSIEQELLFLYVTRGLKAVQDKYNDSTNEQVKELIEYISSVENFKKVKEAEEAAKALSVELHSIDRVPPEFLRDQEVWNELIPNMDIQTLLDNLQRISILGFLKNSNSTVMKVVDVFNNLHKAETFKGHPTRVYIELITYEKAAKYCLDVANKLAHPISKIVPAKKPPKTNLLIKNALTIFFYSLFKFQKPTGLRYFVAVDLRPKMFSDRCHYRTLIAPIEAAQALCISLIRTEHDNNVSVGVFTDPKSNVTPVSFNKESPLSKYESTFEEYAPKAGPASVVTAINFAATNKKPVDVFIVLSNHSVLTSGTRAAINKYRTDMNLPNTKLVTCSLTGNLRTHKDVEGQNMLCVIGFDEHVYRLIEAFAQNRF